MHAAKLSQLRILLFSNNSDRQLDVEKSIIVLFSITQTRTPVC